LRDEISKPTEGETYINQLKSEKGEIRQEQWKQEFWSENCMLGLISLFMEVNGRASFLMPHSYVNVFSRFIYKQIQQYNYKKICKTARFYYFSWVYLNGPFYRRKQCLIRIYNFLRYRISLLSSHFFLHICMLFFWINA
jgi:hypothetical protein